MDGLKKYKVILTTTYTYEVDARNGDEAIYKATCYKVNDEAFDEPAAKEETAVVEEI